LEFIQVSESGPFNITLPGVASAITSDTMKKLGFSGDIFSGKIRLGQISQTSIAVFDMLEAIMPTQGSNIETASMSAVRQDSVWTINMTERLWKLVSRWILACGVDLHQELVKIVSQFLRFVLKCTDNFSGMFKAEFFDIQSGKLLLESMATVLSTQRLYDDPTLQYVLTECIEGIQKHEWLSPSFKTNAETIVIPKIMRLRHDEDSFTKTSKPFQVRQADHRFEVFLIRYTGRSGRSIGHTC
jgi:hypothetical protein